MKGSIAPLSTTQEIFLDRLSKTSKEVDHYYALLK